MHIHGAEIPDILISPNHVQQVLPAVHPARVAHQQLHQVELLGGQLHGDPVPAGRPLPRVEDNVACGQLIAASLLLGSGVMKRRQRRFATYLRTAGQKPAVPLDYLARAANVSRRKVEKDVNLMLEKGLWGDEAYIDLGSGMLFRSQAAATAYFDKARQMQQPEEPAVQPQAAEGYTGILRQIRELNDRIADEAISAKLDRMEQVSGRIFKLIEEDEAKRDAAGTFLNYYLPTTLKLLENYASFEEAGVSGENLSQAKAKIEKTMDSIVAGFEHQLDELYRTDAMDIDSDIRVMETMLRRDTASVADDFGLNGSSAVQQRDE